MHTKVYFSPYYPNFMNSPKITSILMVFLFLSSLFSTSGCLEETNDNNIIEQEDVDDYANNNGNGNQNNNGGEQDSDSDNDGYPDNMDDFPYDKDEWKDSDDDSIGDNADKFPNDSCASDDMDDDGKPDSIKENCNTSLTEDDDIDGDGFSNEMEMMLGTNPKSAASKPLDYDGDETPDGLDDDMDNDGMNNSMDQCPRGSMNWKIDSSTDWDNDGCKDSDEDNDDDNDGIIDEDDLCIETPLNEVPNQEGCSASQRDSDGDGIVDSLDICWGNDSTGDSDGDGLCSDNDKCSDGPFLYGEEVDIEGCSFFEKSILWNGGSYSAEYMGTVGDFTIPEPIDENLNFTNNWVFSEEWSGKDTYVFVIYNPCLLYTSDAADE